MPPKRIAIASLNCRTHLDSNINPIQTNYGNTNLSSPNDRSTHQKTDSIWLYIVDRTLCFCLCRLQGFDTFLRDFTGRNQTQVFRSKIDCQACYGQQEEAHEKSKRTKKIPFQSQGVNRCAHQSAEQRRRNDRLEKGTIRKHCIDI